MAWFLMPILLIHATITMGKMGVRLGQLILRAFAEYALLASIHSLCYETEDGYRAHEKDSVVESSPRNLSFLVIRPCVDE